MQSRFSKKINKRNNKIAHYVSNHSRISSFVNLQNLNDEVVYQKTQQILDYYFETE